MKLYKWIRRKAVAVRRLIRKAETERRGVFALIGTGRADDQGETWGQSQLMREGTNYKVFLGSKCKLKSEQQ